MKLTSDNETLAEGKVIILYILNKLPNPISNEGLYKLVLSINDMNYFYFQQFLLDLMDNKPVELKWTDKVSHGVVLASTNYPASSTKGSLITGVDDVDGLVFHMGTKMTDEGLVTDGGRVLMVVTLEDDLQTAFDYTYKELEKIQCKDLFHRNDIGKKDM